MLVSEIELSYSLSRIYCPVPWLKYSSCFALYSGESTTRWLVGWSMTPDSFVPVSCIQTSTRTMNCSIAIWRNKKHAGIVMIVHTVIEKMRRHNGTSINKIIRVWNYFVCRWFLPRLRGRSLPSSEPAFKRHVSWFNQQQRRMLLQLGDLLGAKNRTLPHLKGAVWGFHWQFEVFAVRHTIELHIPLFNRPHPHQKQDISWYRAYLGSQNHQ